MARYDAGEAREALAKTFYELVNDEAGLDRSTVIKQFVQDVVRQADETRMPLENILNELEADALDIAFGADGSDPDDEPPRASERFLD